MGTFIVECTEETWQRAGLTETDEAASVAFCEALFADHLGGRRLRSNRSHWLKFLTLRHARWSHENIVLLGDAAHTAHFSIGSGTKLAMEDAIALATAFEQHARCADRPPRLCARSQAARRIGPAGGGGEPALFRECRAVRPPRADAVRRQSAHPQRSDHLRQPPAARPRASSAASTAGSRPPRGKRTAMFRPLPRSSRPPPSSRRSACGI